jgi:hypothetical protein
VTCPVENAWLVNVVVAVDTPSTGNLREHWSRRARRVKAQREAVAQRLRRCQLPPTRALEVHLVRVSPRYLDGDNLQSALKPIRDAVAAWLGVTDGPRGPVTWTYDQEPPPPGRKLLRCVGVLVRALDHGADGGRDEGLTGSADVSLGRETSCHGAQAEPLGSQNPGPPHCGLLLRLDHEDTSLADGMTERCGPERLASTPLDGHGAHNPSPNLGAFELRHRRANRPKECRLRALAVAHAVCAHDDGPCACHGRGGHGMHQHTTCEAIGLVNRQDARAMRAEVLEGSNEPWPIGHTRPARNAVLVHGDKLHTFSARPFGEGFTLHCQAEELPLG